MYFERIESFGISHYSYIIGDKNEAVVIDPRRDVGVYLEKTRDQGMIIKYILETHRNEDYIIGSIELSAKTGAKILISGHEDLGHVYGDKIYDGDKIEIGDIKIEALHTPGHTLGHMSYVVYENNRKYPYLVFTGDCLFMGDLGRTDFYGKENLEKTTGLLYESIFNKLFPLGDDVLVFPAHGPGSACGESMEERPYTTLGYERKNNPKLQVSSKEEFIKNLARMRIKPRYFEAMEEYNTKGTEFAGETVVLEPLLIKDAKEQGITLIDIREKEAFCGGHIPGALFFSRGNISTYIGTVLNLNTPVALITEGNDMEKLNELYWLLKRIGFDSIKGFISYGNAQWEASGNDLEILKTIKGKDYMKLDSEHILLDVRKSESALENVKNYMNIPLQYLNDQYKNIPSGKKVYVLCASGDRSTTAASFLKGKGIDARVIAGGLLTVDLSKV